MNRWIMSVSKWQNHQPLPGSFNYLLLLNYLQHSGCIWGFVRGGLSSGESA